MALTFCCPWHRGVEWRTRQETTDGLTVIIQDDSGWLESVLKHAHELLFLAEYSPNNRLEPEHQLQRKTIDFLWISHLPKFHDFHVMLGNMTILTGEERLATKVPPLSWRFHPFFALPGWQWKLGYLREAVSPCGCDGTLGTPWKNRWNGCPPGNGSSISHLGKRRIIDSKVTIGRGYDDSSLEGKINCMVATSCVGGGHFSNDCLHTFFRMILLFLQQSCFDVRWFFFTKVNNWGTLAVRKKHTVFVHLNDECTNLAPIKVIPCYTHLYFPTFAPHFTDLYSQTNHCFIFLLKVQFLFFTKPTGIVSKGDSQVNF